MPFKCLFFYPDQARPDLLKIVRGDYQLKNSSQKTKYESPLVGSLQNGAGLVKDHAWTTEGKLGSLGFGNLGLGFLRIITSRTKQRTQTRNSK